MNIFRNNLFSILFIPGRFILLIIVLGSLAVASYVGYRIPLSLSGLYQSYEHTTLYYVAMKILLVIFCAEYLNRLIYQLAIERYVLHVMQKMRSFCYEKWIFALEMRNHKKDNYPLGEVLARIMNDSESIRELITSGSFNIFIDFFFVVSCLISFISLNTTSGIFLIVAEVMACLFLVWGSKKMRVVFTKVRVAIGQMSRIVADVTGGLSQSYFMPQNSYSSMKSEKVFDQFLKVQLQANVWDASYYSLAESLFPILLALVVIIFPYSNIVEVAIIAAIIDLIQRSIGPIKDIAGKLSNIQRAMTGLKRIQEFTLDLEKLPSLAIKQINGLSEFNQMEVFISDFSYDAHETREVFKLLDINFTLKQGELVGIVGRSGCGKSTLLNILAANIISENVKIKLMQNEREALVLNGREYDKIPTYRQIVSIVSQDSHIFSSNLQFNITFKEGDDPLFEKFWDKISKEIIYLKRWGIGPKDKIDPTTISLGQKQLISGLRSCYLKKPLILFDEISSGLDSDLEEALRSLLLYSQRRALTLIVAHRIETVKMADNILVMDQGKIINHGTHQELLDSSELYQEFIQGFSHFELLKPRRPS